MTIIQTISQNEVIEDDATYAENMAEGATSDSELQVEIQAMMMIADEKEALNFRHELEKNTRNHILKQKLLRLHKRKCTKLCLMKWRKLSII